MTLKNLMKPILFCSTIILLVIIFPTAHAESESIPSWVKNTAGWWANNEISENEFVNAIQYLINKNIVYVEKSTPAESSQGIPSWVKNTAGWWANNEIHENEFVNAIQFLINVGIITINENTQNKINDYLLTWDEIVSDANFAFTGSLTLKNYFVPNDLPLIVNGNPDLHVFTESATYDLLTSSISMYQITGEDMYLEQARKTADFIEGNSLTDKSLLIYWNPHTGTILEKCCTTNQEILSDVSKLAMLDSRYDELVKKLADEIIEYEINPQTQLFYSGLEQNGIPGISSMYLSYGGSDGLESLLLAYEVTSDEKYLNQVKKTILAYWDLRNKDTNLIPSMINAETNEIEQNFMQQYGAGIFLKILLHYYYLTDDPEILSIMKIYSDSVIEYFWDGKTWEYRVNFDGTVMSPSIEANFGKLDDALFLLYELDPTMFKDTYNFAKSDYSNSLQDDLIVSDNLVIHSVKDDGSRDSPHSMMNYAFLINQNIGTRLYQDTSDIEYLSNLHQLYDAIITNHKREFGYVHGIDAYSKEEVDYYNSLQLNQRSPANIANKINLTFIPSADVSIIWTKIGNYELSEPFITTFTDHGRFNNIEFDYKHRSIDLKTVYGEGTITFANKIDSVIIDGKEYDNFNDYTLNTLDGKHQYQVFLQT